MPEYTLLNGKKAVVAPLIKKNKANNSKARDHALLKQDRPSYITILSLVRDAAAKLEDGVGTRADICELLKDSQYITENLTDSQINSIVSGALDRLHYEKDPCDPRGRDRLPVRCGYQTAGTRGRSRAHHH